MILDAVAEAADGVYGSSRTVCAKVPRCLALEGTQLSARLVLTAGDASRRRLVLISLLSRLEAGRQREAQ